MKLGYLTFATISLFLSVSAFAQDTITCTTGIGKISLINESNAKKDYFTIRYVEDGKAHFDKTLRASSTILSAKDQEGIEYIYALTKKDVISHLTQKEVILVSSAKAVVGILEKNETAVGLITLYDKDQKIVARFSSAGAGYVARCREKY